jgi:hypothetical protein
VRRRRCSADGCRSYGEYRFDPNFGVLSRRPLVLWVCQLHLLGGVLAAMRYQEQHGDLTVSLLVEKVTPSRPARPAPKPAVQPSAR